MLTRRHAARMACSLCWGNEEGEEHDALAVKRALAALGVDVNVTEDGGCTSLWVQCCLGRSRNVKVLLADPRVAVGTWPTPSVDKRPCTWRHLGAGSAASRPSSGTSAST